MAGWSTGSSDPGTLGNIDTTGPDSSNTISSSVSNKLTENNNNCLTITKY